MRPVSGSIDSTAKQLYLSVAENDDPNKSVIEMKRRQNAVDLTGRSHIRINGLQIIASYAACVDVQGTGHLVSHNTLRVIVEKSGDYLVGAKANTSKRLEAVVGQIQPEDVGVISARSVVKVRREWEETSKPGEVHESIRHFISSQTP
jgi:hypothetical protein